MSNDYVSYPDSVPTRFTGVQVQHVTPELEILAEILAELRTLNTTINTGIAGIAEMANGFSPDKIMSMFMGGMG